MAEIKIGQYIILCDDKYFDILSKHNWRIKKHSHTNYAITTISGTTVAMHQIVLPNDDPYMIIDHKDRNGLNNLESNLQIISQSSNTRRKRIGINNTSGFKGVSWDKNRKMWYASIQVHGQTINLGRFYSNVDAAEAYNKAAVKYFKEFAELNQF